MRKRDKTILQMGVIVLLLCALSIAFYMPAHADTITYNYYETGELKRVVYSGGTTIEYVYDASGNRTRQVITSGEPGISASPNPVNFDPIIVGSSSAAQSVTITNTGTIALEIESVSIGGTSASDFTKQTDTCTGQTLATAGTCTIGVFFTAKTPAGTKTATLQIVSNSADMPVLSVAMSGVVFDQYSALTITRAGTGTGTVTVDTGTISWSGNTGTASYTPGTSVTITATADSNSQFTSWSGACAGNASPCSLTIDANKSVTATFASYADFSGTPVTGPLPLTVAFTDLSINSPTSWLWDFGDGTTSPEQNPTHIYKTAGAYTVSLTATGTNGSVTMTKTNYVVVNACGNLPVKLGSGALYYPTIQDAYNAAGDGGTVQIQGLDLTQNVNLNQNISVLLKGGYNCDYTSNPGHTTINGLLDILDGAVTLENIKIK